MTSTNASTLPFQVTQASDSDFAMQWSSERGGDSTFFAFAGRRSDAFRPCGDYVVYFDMPGWSSKVQLIAPLPGKENMLAHPVDFHWILDDHGSGNRSSIAYYWPIAPQGYVALGVAMGGDGQPPYAGNYWCVAQRLCVQTTSTPYWGDGNQHWTSHNGDLSIPTTAQPLTPDIQS